MFSRVSGQCGIGTWCQRWREAPIITVSTTARSAHYHGVSGFALAAGINDGAPIITVSRASPSRLGRGALHARGSLYELVLTNLYKKMYELYELVLYNLYKKCRII